MPEAFYLVHLKDGTYIANPRLNVRVEIRELDTQPLVVGPGIMDFYHSDAGKIYAFLAEVAKAEFEDITKALVWYANQQEWEAANFQMTDPRIRTHV